MSVTLRSPIASLKGLKAEDLDRFAHLGILNLQDALFHFPIRHEDWRNVVPFGKLQPDTKVTVAGTLEKIQARRAWRRRATMTEAVFMDDQKQRLHVTWFNLPYLATWLKVGERYFLSGKVVRRRGRIEMQQPVHQRVQSEPMHERLVPIYPSTGGLTQWQIRKVLREAVALAPLISDMLPTAMREGYSLVPLSTALENIHFPKDPAALELALRRLKFDELLAWQIAWRLAYAKTDQSPAPTIPFEAGVVRHFVQSLPFELTPDQRQAAWDILQDLQKSEPMSRLVQGDVGSGKTVVAAVAALNAIRAGYQVILMAPTVVLAEQHAATLKKFLTASAIPVALWSSGRVEVDGHISDVGHLANGLRNGDIPLVIATHAALEPGIHWHKLGLVIVDEQQRFGVRQRQRLLETTQRDAKVTPHFLSLTATPIPRTLALTLAGDLQISSLKHKPAGRLPIETVVVPPAKRKMIVSAIEGRLDLKEQVYVITPLIEESDMLGVRAATTEFERLRELLPHARVGLVHGSLPADERIAILEKFRAHEIDVLVSTTVIEVGVDVPNATLMVIEGAERFGLSQLHQLRGRVGRGTAASLCLLATDSQEAFVLKRLKRVADTNDGFAISELDLEIRGTGDLYGVRQSGLPAWKLATIQDAELFAETREAAKQLLAAPAGSLEAKAAEQLIQSLPVAHRE